MKTLLCTTASAPTMATSSAPTRPPPRAPANPALSLTRRPRPPAPKSAPGTVRVELETIEKVGELNDDLTYHYATFDGWRPGSMIHDPIKSSPQTPESEPRQPGSYQMRWPSMRSSTKIDDGAVFEGRPLGYVPDYQALTA